MMLRALPVLLLLLSSALTAAESGVAASAPVINFKLPVLNEQGIRTSLLRGSEARYISSTQIDLVGMQYTTFIENTTNEVDTTLLAPTASVLIDNEKVLVRGNENVRLIRNNVDVTGEQWAYEQSGKKGSTPKKIVIERNVRVVFQIELKNILK
jgi:hypothetical protein